MKVNLNELIAAGLPIPEGRSKIEYTDSGPGSVPGLLYEVRASTPRKAGAPVRASIWLRYKNGFGETKYQKLGYSDNMTLASARQEAKRLKAKIVLGADPRADANAKKQVPTFSQFFVDHYMPYVRPRKRSADRDEELFRIHVEPRLGNTRLNLITRQAIQGIMTGMTERGYSPGTADLVGRFIRHALFLAQDWSFIPSNPAARLPMFNVDNRVAQYLDDAELERLLHVLRTDKNRAVCRVALFLISTGCRLNEALSASWTDVDLERRVLTIRATNSKSRKQRSIPLNDSAMDVLRSLDTREQGGPLFRGRRGEPLRYIAKVWDRLRKEAGLPRLRLHDLRHQFASFLVNDGRTLYEVQALLGHSSSRVTERYSCLNSRTLQQAAASASAKLNGGGSKTA